MKNAWSFIRRALDLVYRDTAMRLAARLLPARVMRLPKYFSLWERRGYHVTPVHYYRPIPDCAALPETLWTAESSLREIDWDEAGQLRLLQQLGSHYSAELDQFPMTAEGDTPGYYWNNDFFTGADAALGYSVVRHFKPRTILEVGSGFSTLLAAQALQRNGPEGHAGQITAIEPYPNATLRAGFAGLETLIVEPVQNVALECFEALDANDILFIDSSHVTRLGGDVNFLFLEVLPRLKPGVVVHVHDIFLPYEYPRDWVFTRRWFFSEQYLLQAFLSFNHAFRVLLAGHYLSRQHYAALESAFGARVSGQIHIDGVPQTLPAASFWMQRTPA